MESHETPHQSPNADEARQALESIADIRKQTAHSAASPKGFYAVVGIGEGLLIAAVGGEHPLRYLAFIVGLIIVFGGMMWYSKVTGVVAWAKVWEPWAWRSWIMAGAAILGLVAASAWGQTAGIIGGIATAIVWAIAGPAFDRSWVRQIEDQP